MTPPVRCQECGDLLRITDRHARRIEGKPTAKLCPPCRSRDGRPITVTDADFRFWANRFGVVVPRGRTARSVLVEGPLPEALSEILAALKPGA